MRINNLEEVSIDLSQYISSDILPYADGRAIMLILDMILKSSSGNQFDSKGRLLIEGLVTEFRFVSKSGVNLSPARTKGYGRVDDVITLDIDAYFACILKEGSTLVLKPFLTDKYTTKVSLKELSL